MSQRCGDADRKWHDLPARLPRRKGLRASAMLHTPHQVLANKTSKQAT